jgi:hypothetical protein
MQALKNKKLFLRKGTKGCRFWILHEALRFSKSQKGEPPMVFTSIGFNKNLLDGFRTLDIWILATGPFNDLADTKLMYWKAVNKSTSARFHAFGIYRPARKFTRIPMGKNTNPEMLP